MVYFMEHPIKIQDLGVYTPIFGNIHLVCWSNDLFCLGTSGHVGREQTTAKWAADSKGQSIWGNVLE